jgi:radical SAM protein with 4Fe4S-binding SPASM domain
MHIQDLRLVEIEIANYCNRTCGFCPNLKHPRNDMSKVEYLNMDRFKLMIDTLQVNGYTGAYTFSRYNEPLATPDKLKEYISYIRSKCANKIITNTNGDFIERDLIVLFDEISFMDYDNRGLTHWVENLIHMKPNSTIAIHGKDNPEFIKTQIDNTTVLVFIDFIKNATIEDRGGVVDPIFVMKNNHDKRNRPCLEPKYFLGIDYTGDVMPCCNLRHDFHEDAILGNINKQSILEIIESDTRKLFLDKAYNTSYHGCTHCQKDPGRYTRDIPGIDYKGERK